MWSIYIIEADNGYFYTGITKSIEKRFHHHQKTSLGAKFFNISSPKKIVYLENAPDRSSALKREHQIKKLTRKEKENLIRSSPFEESHDR
jgi:putative endonuclease